MAQTIEAYVGDAMDNARDGADPLAGAVAGRRRLFHRRDRLHDVRRDDARHDPQRLPDRTRRRHGQQRHPDRPVPRRLGQGEFTDRFGRKAVYQFNLLLFGLATIAGAWAPNLTWLLVAPVLRRHRSGRGATAVLLLHRGIRAQAIRGRIIALMQFIGGAWPGRSAPCSCWSSATSSIGAASGSWSASSRWSSSCCASRCRNRRAGWRPTARGKRALDLLQRMGLRRRRSRR